MTTTKTTEDLSSATPETPKETPITQKENTKFGGFLREVEHRNGVWSLAQLQNGYLAGGNRDGVIRVWNTKDGSTIMNITGLVGSVKSLKLLKNGNLASGDDSGIVNIWNTTDGSLVRALIGHRGTVFSLAEFPNGDLASGDITGMIIIWNTDTGVLKRNLKGHNSGVASLMVI